MKHMKSWRHDNIFYYDLILLTFVVCSARALANAVQSSVLCSFSFFFLSFGLLLFTIISFQSFFFPGSDSELHHQLWTEAGKQCANKKIFNLILGWFLSSQWHLVENHVAHGRWNEEKHCFGSWAPNESSAMANGRKSFQYNKWKYTSLRCCTLSSAGAVCVCVY